MAPRKVIKQKKRSKFAHWTATCTDFLEKQVFTWPMFSNQSHFQLITYLLLVAELFINLFIVNFCKCKQPFSFVFQVPHFLPVSLYNRHGDWLVDVHAASRMLPKRHFWLRTDLRQHGPHCLPRWSPVPIHSLVLRDKSRHQHLSGTEYLCLPIPGHIMDCISPLFKPFKGTHRQQILSNMGSISYVHQLVSWFNIASFIFHRCPHMWFSSWSSPLIAYILFTFCAFLIAHSESWYSTSPSTSLHRRNGL